MSILVAKFGGTSVATPGQILASAEKIAEEVSRGHTLAVIVSAMAGQTNALLDLADSYGPQGDGAEKDAIMASGEQVSAAMMAMALQSLGLKARSWQGWQARIRCDDLFGKARIQGIESEAIQQAMEGGEIPVITGFQGVSEAGRLVTLGRGGSDLSAVAIASALGAQRCDIYTDVDGIYNCDPRIVPEAKKIPVLPCEAMLEMASLGSKVLQTRSVALAMKEGVDLQVLSSFASSVGSDRQGTLLVKDKSDMMESEIVTSVAHTLGEAQITLCDIPDRPGIVADLFQCLGDAEITVDMIVQTASAKGEATQLTFTVPETDADQAETLLKEHSIFGGCLIKLDRQIAKISIVGVGLRSYTQLAGRAFEALAEAGVNILAISTSEIRLSLLVREEHCEDSVRILHNIFQLE